MSTSRVNASDATCLKLLHTPFRNWFKTSSSNPFAAAYFWNFAIPNFSLFSNKDPTFFRRNSAQCLIDYHYLETLKENCLSSCRLWSHLIGINLRASGGSSACEVSSTSWLKKLISCLSELKNSSRSNLAIVSSLSMKKIIYRSYHSNPQYLHILEFLSIFTSNSLLGISH